MTSEQTPITLDESMEIVLNVCGDWLADIDPEYSEDLVGVPVGRVEDAYRFLRTIKTAFIIGEVSNE